MNGWHSGVVIPYGVTEIGKMSFAFYTDEVDELVIPDTVKIIREEAFSMMNVKKIVFGNGLEEICERAFAYCNCLTEVVFPRSLKKIYARAFE